MAKREYVALAHKYKDQVVADMYASEKLDGIRAIWDGGISRGILASEVPYANTTKDFRYRTPPVATGLWTRYGKVIQAPSWFLDALPKIILDGELWISRDSFQDLTSIVKALNPDESWDQVTYNVFNVPFYKYWLADGRIYNPNMDITLKNAWKWAEVKASEREVRLLKTGQSLRNAIKIMAQYPETEYYKPIKFKHLSACSIQARKDMLTYFDSVLAAGGEGIMLSNPNGYWQPQRSYDMLKMKGVEESEAKVVGYIYGEETDLGSKLLGMVGSLLVEWQGKRFNLSGLTNEERALPYEFRSTAESNPGCAAGPEVYSDVFPIGSTVTFRYRSLTKDGLPKEARYLRKREYE